MLTALLFKWLYTCLQVKHASNWCFSGNSGVGNIDHRRASLRQSCFERGGTNSDGRRGARGDGSARFSPGEIHGRYGDDLAIAVKGYQEEDGMRIA
jgi:hypothetical protein